MCGRYVSVASRADLAELFDAEPVGEELRSRWNVAPTQTVYTVTSNREGDQRRLDAYRWGLVPSWAKDPSIGSRLINARAETLAGKPSFRAALKQRRALIPADGFYEWQKREGRARKTPFYFHRPDDQPFAFAGLWEAWRDAEDRWLRSCTIITTDANEVMAPVHDRMPVVLDPTSWQEWLAPQPLDPGRLAELLAPPPDDLLTAHEVSTAVNNVRTDGAELITPVNSA
jgi:putative SOS response-associated peptidase YedK